MSRLSDEAAPSSQSQSAALWKEESDVSRKGTKSLFQVTLLGISLVLGGQCVFWNTALQMGTIEFLLSTIISAVASFGVYLFLAEMTSALPFGGGLYGFIRITLGPYMGFLIGWCELLQTLMYSSSLLLFSGIYIVQLLGISLSYAYLVSIVLLVVSTGINLLGAKYFWRSNMILVIISLFLFLVYYAVALPCADCRRYGGGMLDSAPKLKATWLGESYVTQQLVFGLELLPLACSEAVNPKKTIPRAFLLSFTVIAINALLLVIAVGCNAPGNVAVSLDFDTPLYHVFMSGLHVSKQVAKALVLPAMFATAVVFGYKGALLMRSMADSGLFPAVFKRVYGSERIPYVAQFVGSGFMLLHILLERYAANAVLFYCVEMTAMFVDIIVLLSFLRFQKAFPSLERLFQLSDRLGKVIAYPTLALFIARSIFYLIFKDHFVSFFFFLGNMLIATMLYLWRVKSQQSLSKEEQRVLFVAYVINTNRSKKKVSRRRLIVEREKVRDTVHENSNHSAQSKRVLPSHSLAIWIERCWERIYNILFNLRQALFGAHSAKLHPATTAGSDRGHDLKSHEGQKNCDNTSDLLILEGGNPSLHFDMSTSVHYGRSSCFSLNNGANNGKSIDGWAAMALQQNLGMKEREYEACLLDEDARSSQDVDGKAIEQFDINTRLNLNFPASKRVGSTDLIDDTVKVKATHCRVYQSDKMREDVESEENENPSSLRHRTVASRRHSVVCPLDNRGYSFPVLSARHGFQQVDDGPQEMDEVVHLAEEVSKIRSRDLPHLLQRSFSRMLAKLSGSRSLDYGYEGYEVLLEGEDALSPLPRVGSSHKEVEEVSENGCDRQSFLN